MPDKKPEYKLLRSAAVYAANDTYYECTNTIYLHPEADSIRLYIDATVGSPGDMHFFIQSSTGLTATFYDYSDSSGGEYQEWGPLSFSGVDDKSFDLKGLNLPPYEEIKVWFKCSAGAAGTQIAISAAAFNSDKESGGDTAVIAGSLATIETNTGTTATNTTVNLPVSVPGTGAGAISLSTGIAVAAIVPQFRISFTVAPVSAGNLTLTVDSAAGATYDSVFITESMVGVDNIIFGPDELGIPGFELVAGDNLVAAYANPDGRTWYAEWIYREI